MMEQGTTPLIIVAGPTAVGKSEVAVALAKRIRGSIISADSMQVYRGMDIGSAKITPLEMQGVPHYLIDILMPDDEFHVVRFQGLAKKSVDEIRLMGRIPILCGGTGFYIQSLLYDIDFTEESSNGKIRADLTRIAETEGSERLHEMLMEIDPEAAEEIHPNNVKRMIRAIEFYRLSGQMISEHNEKERMKPPAYKALYCCLTMDRETLYKRIDERVDKMLEKGLLAEVQRLRDQGYTKDMVSMQGLGYQELLRYLSGELTFDEAVRRIKRDSRHFAKRQLTWFKRERDVFWIERDRMDTEAVVDTIIKAAEEKGIL